MSSTFRPRRILVVASFADSILDFRGALLDRMRAAGLDVHVAAPGLERPGGMRERLLARGFTPHGIALDRTGRNPLRDVFSLASLWRTIRGLRPDIFLGYTIKPVIYGTLVAWLARVPKRFALITGLGYTFQNGKSGRFARWLAARLYAASLRRAHRVIFQNRDDETLFREQVLHESVPTLVVDGSGVDLRHHGSMPVPAGAPTFLMICRLLGSKGVREYAEAARRIRARYPEARCDLAGWIDEGPDAIAAGELGDWVASGAITFLGRLEDVRPALADCTVYVLPSYREGMPRTVLEAMATGRAVITTDAPGCRTTVVDGDNGFLVPVGDVDALESAMTRFIEDAALAARMGSRSRTIACERFDVRNVNKAMLEGLGIQHAND